MVAVADEVHVSDAEDIDRRHPFATANGLGDALPAAPHAPRRRPEAAVELAGAVHGADDRIEIDRVQPERALTAPPERGDYLVEGEDHIDVAGLPAKAPCEIRAEMAPPRAAEVRLRVCRRETCVQFASH